MTDVVVNTDRSLVWRKAWLVFLALTVLALAIRLAWLGRKSLWIDEIYTLGRAMQPPTAISAVQGDPHPTLYYLGLHYWLGVGRSEVALRFPSAVLGAVAVGLLYLVGREMGLAWAGAVGAALLAVSPQHVWLSQETRMYSAVCAAGIVSALFFVRAIRRMCLSDWLFWVAFTTLGFYVDYSMVSLLVMEGVLFPAAWRLLGAAKRVWVVAPLAFACVLAMILPSLGFLARGVISTGESLYFGRVQFLLAQEGWNVSASRLMMATAAVGIVGLISLGAVGWWSSGRLRGNVYAPGWVVGLSLAVYALVTIVSAVPRGLGFKRQLLVLLPYFFLAVAWSVQQVRHRNWAVGVLVIVTLPALLMNLLVNDQEPWRAVASWLVAEANPSQDIVLLNAAYCESNLNYYYDGPVTREGVGPQDVPDRLAAVTAMRARVWLILCDDDYSDPRRIVSSWLDSQFSLLSQRTYGNLRVALYGRSLSASQ